MILTPYFIHYTESLYKGHLTQALVITKIQGLAYIFPDFFKNIEN